MGKTMSTEHHDIWGYDTFDVLIGGMRPKHNVTMDFP
uniref:Uncharacterized protein n=1 Tax=Anguilla anguilla TaxID=7936 RepID=A0A0E9VDT2_ANGAN